jgi:hypothetical protein
MPVSQVSVIRIVALAATGCLAFAIALAGASAASGSGVPCLPSRARHLNRQDQEAYVCLTHSAKTLREDALTDVKSDYLPCKAQGGALPENQDWTGVEEDGDALVTFADQGMVAAAEIDGGVSVQLEQFKDVYVTHGTPHQSELLLRAIRELKHAKTEGEKATKEVRLAGQALEAHSCEGLLDHGEAGLKTYGDLAEKGEYEATKAVAALVSPTSP